MPSVSEVGKLCVGVRRDVDCTTPRDEIGPHGITGFRFGADHRQADLSVVEPTSEQLLLSSVAIINAAMIRAGRASPRRCESSVWELAAHWDVYVPLTLLAVSHTWTNSRQPLPYMDELFHVPQAQRVCNAFPMGLLSIEYDPSITTPPGIYLLPAVLNLVSPYFCSTQGLRLISAVLVALVIPNAAAILQSLKNRLPLSESENGAGKNPPSSSSTAQCTKAAVLVAMHPVLFFYGNLFYTDPPAVFFLLLCFRFSLAQKPVSSALCGMLSACCRQTCAVLHAHIAFDELLFMKCQGKAPTQLVRTALPHAAAGLVYISLFRWNSYHVALGHQAHHPVSLHPAMLPYYAGFLAVFSTPLLFASTSLTKSNRQGMIRFATYLIRCTGVHVSALLAALILFACVVATGDYAHPFSLSDNRHYVFYLYRRILLRSHYFRLAALPLYMLGMGFPFISILMVRHRAERTIARKAVSSENTTVESNLETWWRSELLSEASLLIAMTLCVVPSTLLELRYFVPGFVVVALRVLSRAKLWRWQTYGALLLLAFCNIVLVLVFCEAPFQRARDPHMPSDTSLGRFMF